MQISGCPHPRYLPLRLADRLTDSPPNIFRCCRKSLPLDREEAESWHAFVIAAFRTRAVIDAEAFINWLAAAGWSKESAAELNSQFLDHCHLLSRYADEVSAA